MNKGFEQLQIDEEFRTLIRPLRKEEYIQLEINLKIDGCREPIIVWDGVIVDGHNRYEICNRLHIPYAVREMPFASREDVTAWICANQLGRRNITEETRKYLIGKQYEAEKVVGKRHNICGNNQFKRLPRSERGERETFRRTAEKLSAKYNVSTGAVQKYAIYSKALDTISEENPEFSQKVLAGDYKISHENIVTLSRMSPEEVRKVAAKPDGLPSQFIRYSESRKEFAEREALMQKKDPPHEVPGIKITPAYDPDSEITGLTLTIPSWVSSIERARHHSDISAISSEAKSKLEDALLSLQKKISDMLMDIKEDT